MHPFLYLALMLCALGGASYGVMMMPLANGPKQGAQLGLVVIFLAILARHFDLF